MMVHHCRRMQGCWHRDEAHQQSKSGLGRRKPLKASQPNPMTRCSSILSARNEIALAQGAIIDGLRGRMHLLHSLEPQPIANQLWFLQSQIAHVNLCQQNMQVIA
eukprot:52300-Amphidinium_carterae.2